MSSEVEISCKININEKSLGSSQFKLNESVIFCTIYGLYDCKIDSQDNIEVIYKDNSASKVKETYYAETLKEVITPFLYIDNNLHNENKYFKIIFVANSGYEMCYSDSKSFSSNAFVCCINAGILALVQAGIPLKSLFYASTSFKLPDEFLVFKNGLDRPFYIHAFGDCEDIDMQVVGNTLKNIRDEVDFCLEKGMEMHLF
ncbi:hypothetical protein EDEG_02512 [Edhazardia aedis USNM 41457]|uniref:Exoribonuclease phosphorolytic domain-containing protein n=1 Tax=Edhazardia aedis (strain USNM 41457) TaxID=1003232 RepID=J9D6G7_EDHAE|nr:hypothetical protein EDEG_02512 [Edhazardia aedis USNM 41457]|eukprot:EJW03104.1 hypothetical protein EDEG_02512 [Edhazardia aedis USNM 41457]